MRTQRLLIPLLLLLLLLLSFAGWALAAPPAAPVPTLERSVVAAGGGRGADGTIVMFSTIGQPVAGRSPPGDDFLCTGFWCSGEAYSVYLPLVIRNA